MFFISCKTSVDNSCSSGNYDCADVCDGNYIIDNCDNCVLPDDTTCTADCAGVDGGSAQLQNYCTDQDNDGLGEPSSQTGFCNALVDEDSLVVEGWMTDCSDRCNSSDYTIPYLENSWMSCDHSMQSFDICYGSENPLLAFDDYFGKVIWMEMVASW